MPLSDSEIVAICRAEVNTAQGYATSYLADERGTALDFYFGNTESGNIPEAAPGRSNIISMDVHDCVNSSMAEIIPLLRASIVNFQPDNEQDEPQAQMESDYVRNYLEAEGFDEIAYEGVFDAMVAGLGWFKVKYCAEPEVMTRPLGTKLTDPVARQRLVEDAGDDYDVSLHDTEDETIVRIEREIKRLRITAVAPENMLFAPDHGQFDIDEVRFVGERKTMTVDELVRAGLTYEQAQEVPTFNQEDWIGQVARRHHYYGSESDQGGEQQATQLKDTFLCYIDLATDKKGEGPAEKYFVHIAGDHIVEMYPCAFHPYVVGSPLPVSHRIQGRGIFQTQKDVQTQKTHLLRQLNDNAMVANGSRTAYNENKVDVAALTDGRVNGVVPVDGIPGENIFPLPATDITMHMVGVLNYLDSVRSSRGGASTDLTDADRQAMEGNAEAASGIKRSREKMAAYYSRNLTNTFLKPLYLKIHRTMRTYITEPVSASIRGRWVQTVPAQWPSRTRARVINGLTEFDRRQKIQNLVMLNQAQEATIQTGGAGILTDVSKKYNALADWIRVAELGQPEDFLIDPKSPEAMQAQRDKMQEAQQQQQQAQQLMDLQRTMQEMALELDKYKHDTELKFKYWDSAMDSETDIRTTQMDNVTDLAKASQQTMERSNGNNAGD